MMKTFTPVSTATEFSSRSPGKRLFIAASVLAFTACGGVGIDDAASQDDQVGTSAADPDSVAALQQPFLGSDSCRTVDIRVLNSLSYPITVRSLEYYNASEGRWQSEDLANRVVSPGAMEFWTPNFEHAENDWIYSFNVTYDHGSQNGDVYHVNTPDQTCIPGRVFLLEFQ
jgi:hypothetical protein